MESTDKSKSPAPEFGTIKFFLCFIPYLIAIYKGITGIEYGIQGIERFYGISGVIIALITTPPLGIIQTLFCIIYQIVYGLQVIRYHQSLKTFAAAVAIILVIAACFTEALSQEKIGTNANNNIQQVEDPESDGKSSDDILDEIFKQDPSQINTSAVILQK